MKLFVGKMAARCPGCGSNQWHLADPAQTFNVLSKVICAQCGADSTYGDLSLQTPDDDEVSAPRA